NATAGQSLASVVVVAVVADVTRLVGVVVDHRASLDHAAGHHGRAVFIHHRARGTINHRRTVDHRRRPVIDRRRTQRIGHQPDHGAGDNGAGNPATTAPVTAVAI